MIFAFCWRSPDANKLWRYYLMFIFQKLSSLSCKFRSAIHWEVIFVCGVSYVSRTTFFHPDMQFTQRYILKRPSFLQSTVSCLPYVKCWCTWASVSAFSLLFLRFNLLRKCQCLTSFINAALQIEFCSWKLFWLFVAFYIPISINPIAHFYKNIVPAGICTRVPFNR